LPDYEGIIPRMERVIMKRIPSICALKIAKYMTEFQCPECGGARLTKESLAVTVKGKISTR